MSRINSLNCSAKGMVSQATFRAKQIR